MLGADVVIDRPAAISGAPIAKARLCRVVSGEIRPCWVLRAALEDSQKARKGLVPVQYFNSESHLVVTGAIAARSGEHSLAGLLVRFCPFCGKDIGSHLGSDSMAKVG